MNHDYDKIEEKMKTEESEKKKKEMKKSGNSVFKIKEIIQNKSEKIEEEDLKENEKA